MDGKYGLDKTLNKIRTLSLAEKTARPNIVLKSFFGNYLQQRFIYI